MGSLEGETPSPTHRAYQGPPGRQLSSALDSPTRRPSWRRNNTSAGVGGTQLQSSGGGVGLLAMLALQAKVCGEAGWGIVHSGAPRDPPPHHCPLKTLGAHRLLAPQLTPSPEHKCLLGPRSDTQHSTPAGWRHYPPLRGSCPHSPEPTLKRPNRPPSTSADQLSVHTPGPTTGSGGPRGRPGL